MHLAPDDREVSAIESDAVPEGLAHPHHPDRDGVRGPGLVDGTDGGADTHRLALLQRALNPGDEVVHAPELHRPVIALVRRAP